MIRLACEVLRTAHRAQMRLKPGRKPPSPLTVVVEVASLESGGLETVVRDLVLSLDRTRVRPIVACVESAGRIAQEIERGGVPVHVLGKRRSALEWLLERERADVLNAHYSLFGAPVAAAMGIPQVHVLHNSYLWLDNGGARRFAWAFTKVDRFVAVSSSVAEYSRRRFGLRDVEVIPNGIDVEGLRVGERESMREETRAELGLEDASLFLCAGRYEPRKGHVAAIRAFARMATDHPRAVLAFAGDVPDERYLAQCRGEAERAGVAARVRFLPFRRDIERLFAAADAFVLPSLVEGSSLAALQAAAAGLPLLLTDVGAASDLLRAGAAAFVVPAPLEDLLAATPREIAQAEREPAERVVEALAVGMRTLVREAGEWGRRASEAAPAIRAQAALARMAREYEAVFSGA